MQVKCMYSASLGGAAIDFNGKRRRIIRNGRNTMGVYVALLLGPQTKKTFKHRNV